MLGYLVLIAFFIWFMRTKERTVDSIADLPVRVTEKLDQLWQVAHESIKDNKFLRAEKALLTILRVDNKSASAYNRLGILYAKQKSFPEAIECFEIAQSLEPSASSLHNVGLIYFETGDYDKAALAFQQALAIDDSSAARYIAYAKVEEKLGNTNKMLDSLEKAVILDPIPQTLNILADAYERHDREKDALKLRERAARMLLPNAPNRRIEQPRKVIM